MALDMGHEVYVVSRLPPARLPSRQAAQERQESLNRWGLSQATLIPVFGPSKKQALMDLRPHFYADDCAVHCLEARDALVPEIVRPGDQKRYRTAFANFLIYPRRCRRFSKKRHHPVRNGMEAIMSIEEQVNKLAAKQAELERKKQRLLQGDPMGSAEDRKAFLKAMESNDGFGFTWVDLMSLVQICRGQVPEQAIANRENARQGLQCFAPLAGCQPKARG